MLTCLAVIADVAERTRALVWRRAVTTVHTAWFTHSCYIRTHTRRLHHSFNKCFPHPTALLFLKDDLDSGHLTLLHSRLSVHQLTTNFSPKLLHTLTIYCIHFCHHCQPPLNPTALDGAHTHINFLDIQPIFRTVTSSPACCTKTPIRHYLSFYCAVCACTC